MAGRQWVVVSDQTNTVFTLSRFDSASAPLGTVTLPGASDTSGFKIASDADGGAWVSGGTSGGFGLWHVSQDGQTLISSAAVDGEFGIFAGGAAVDASGRVWVAAAQGLNADFSSAKFGLWRFESDASISAGFPVFHQRDNGGVLDGGLSVAVDAAGDVWSAGVSANPATAAYDLALWRFSPDGVARAGFPVYHASAFPDLNEIDSGLAVAGDKVWVAASQMFPGCAAKQQALFRFGATGALEVQRYWHNSAEDASSGQAIAVDSTGNPWVLGRSGAATAVWLYDSSGALDPQAPRTDAGLSSSGISLDAAGAPWVVHGTTPGAFDGTQAVAGAAGLPSCAQVAGITLDGAVTVAGGAPAGSKVTIVASTDGFNNNVYFATYDANTAGPTPFTIAIETPGDYAVGAFLGDNPDGIDLSTPIGFYSDFAPVSLAPGASASGIDFTIALDVVPPSVAVVSPAADSTVAALTAIEGTAADANGVDRSLQMAVLDTNADLWWNSYNHDWIASTSAVVWDASPEFAGAPNSRAWLVRVSSADTGGFGRLDERLVQGHRYRVLASVHDFVGHEGLGETSFIWSGPTGSVGAPPPSGFNGQALGVSSIAWSWTASQGATAYFLATSTFAAPFASVTTTSYIDAGLLPAEHRRLCVAGVNLLAAGPYSCALADADPAVPGAVVASDVGASSATWSWTTGGNGPDASYELSLSTDGFASAVSTPVPVGFYFRGSSYTVMGLSPDTIYTARVRAYNLGLKLSDFSATGSTRTLISAAEAPYNVTALFSRAEAKVSLSWLILGPSPASYRVYRGTESGNLSLLAGTVESAYLDYPGASAFYFYAVSAVDALGGESPLSAEQSVRFDVTPPVIASLLPTDGATLSRPYTVVAEVSDNFTSATVRFEIDGIARATTTVSHRFLWDIRAETDGPHTVRAVATDDDGNEATLARSVTVAYASPAAPAIIVPSDDFSTTATTFTIQGYAPLLTSVSVYLDAQVIGTSAADSIGQWSLPEAAFPGPGDFILTAVAFDEGRGVSGASAPLRVASFAVPPDAPGAVTAAVDRQTGSVELTWAASAGATPAADYRVMRATSATGVYVVLASTPATTFLDFPGASGEYHYRVNAAHGTGLVSAFVAASAVFDVTSPAAITDLRVAAYRPEAGQIDLAWTGAIDDLSGVAQYKLYASTDPQFSDAAPLTIVGSEASYTVGVATSEVRYFALRSVDGAGNESQLSNAAQFDLIPPAITSVDVTPGQVLSRPRVVTVAAADTGSVPRVVFSVDGSALSTVAAPPYSFYFDASAFSDGAHTLGIRAVDDSGNGAETSRALIVNYFPPPVPAITVPAQNAHTASSVLTVSGTGEQGITIEIFVNGAFAGSTTASGLFGSFTAPDLFLPAEGAIAVTASAKDRRGSSPASAPVNVILDFGPPGIPQLPVAQALTGGRIRLTWLPPSGEVPAFYRVYRSADETQLVAGSAANGSLQVASVAAAELVDVTPGDGLYFYAVSAVDAASNEGMLSEVAPAVADGVAPTASVLLPQSTPPLAPGQHLIQLSLSEALATPPILTFTPQGRLPAVVALSGLAPTLWQGTVTINASINSDIGHFAFQGSDFLGNVGTNIVAGGTVTLNARGPVGTVGVSSALASAGTQAITLSLDEPAAAVPTLSVTPFGRAAVPVALTGSGLLWSGALAIDAATGDGQAAIGFSATDSVGNIGTSLSGGATSFVIDTTPPSAPRSLSAAARPGGTVDLLWVAPLSGRPASYFVFRDGVRLASPVTPLLNDNGSFTDSPSEGAHDYAVTAVDAAGNEGPASGTVGSSADQTAPPAPLNLAASAQTSGGQDGVELTWTAGSGEAAAAFRLYRSTTEFAGLVGVSYRESASASFFDVPAEDAHYYYAATALDLAGNESGAVYAGLTFLNAAPRIDVSGIQPGAYYNRDVNPVITASDLNPGSLSASLDGAPFASGAPVSASGLHTLTVNASDLGGHSSSASVVFTIDKVAPQITLSGLADGALLHSTASITIAVTDLSPVTTAHVLTNVTLGSSVAYVSGGVIDDDGSYVLVASATDRAGNTATRSLAFSMDTAPRLPLNLAARLEDGAGADLSWASPGADVLAYRVYKDGARVSASLHTPTTFRDTAYTSDALHVYEITAVDQLGQEGPRAKITIPPVGLSLAGYGLVLNGQEALTRGFSDALRLGFANRDGQPRLLGPSALELSAGGQVYASAQAAAVSVGAGANVESSAVVGVSPLLPSSALLKASVNLPSEAGTSAVLVKTFTLGVREPVAPVVEVFTGALIRGALSQVRVKLNNRGSAPFEVRTAVVEGFAPSPAGEVIASLKTLEGTILSQAGLVQTTGAGVTARVESGKLTYFAAVDPGTSFLFDAVEVEVPVSAGESLKVEGKVKTFTGTQSQAAVAAPAYTATVAAAQPVYDQGSQVILTGSARDQAQALLAGATVQVRITSKGYTRTLTTLTSPSGTYSVTFNPLPNEADVYNLSASAPESVSNAAQASFTIVGFVFSPTTLTARLSQSSSLALNVNLANTGESAVSGLTLQVEGAPAGLNVVLGGAPSTLLAGVQGALSLRLETPTAAVGQFTPVLVARDSNGFERRLPITVDVIGSQPIPRVTPQSFQVGMLAGEVRRQVILLENIGFSSWENVTLSAPTLPWVKIAGTGDMGSIPAGGNASFGISFEPPADLPTGQFVQNPLIEVRSSNNVMIPINVGVTVTSAKQGNLAFTVINADRPRDAQGKGVPVPGADVTLTNLDIAGLTFNGKADANGVVSFTGIPSGSYNWRAQATNFSPSSGVEAVESGLTKEVEAFMFTAMVTYEWGVTESTIKDKYDLTVGVTFKTDVLAPALVVEPNLIEVPISAGQSMLTQYTITNKGLVSAFNLNVKPALKDSAVVLEMPFTTIPELKPGQSIVVPVKVTLLHSSPCHYESIQHSAQYKCAAGVEGKCVIEDVVFKVGQDFECAVGGFVGLTDQAIGFITGTTAPKPCSCETKISGSNGDLIRRGLTMGYSVDVKAYNCPCRLLCQIGTAWAVEGDLEFVGSNTGCGVSVKSPHGGGGTLNVSKGGLVACKPGSRQISGCPVTGLSVTPDFGKTVVGGQSIQYSASALPNASCPVKLEWHLVNPSDPLMGGIDINSGLFTPGEKSGVGTIQVVDTTDPENPVFGSPSSVEVDLATVTIHAPSFDNCTEVNVPLTASFSPPGGILEWKVNGIDTPGSGALGEMVTVPGPGLDDEIPVTVIYTVRGKQVQRTEILRWGDVKTLLFRTIGNPPQSEPGPAQAFYYVGDKVEITASGYPYAIPGDQIITFNVGEPNTLISDVNNTKSRVKTVEWTGPQLILVVEAGCKTDPVARRSLFEVKSKPAP